MRILANAAFPCPDRLEGLTQALLSAMPVRGPRDRMVRESYSCLFPRLPPVCGQSIAVRMRCMAGARGAGGGEAERFLFVCGKQVWFEGGELESGVRPSISCIGGGHRCEGVGVVDGGCVISMVRP